MWLGTSANLHPLLLHLLHLTMCCFAENSCLLQSLHQQFPLSYNFLVSPFSCIFQTFSSLAFLHSIAFMKGLLGTCLPCSSTLHPLLSLHHFSPCSSIHTLRNQSALHLRGGRAAVLKEKFRLQRGSHSVGSIWTENVGVTYCSPKWMLPPVDSWITQTLQNTFHFKPVKCLLCPLWKKLNGINKSKGGTLLF